MDQKAINKYTIKSPNLKLVPMGLDDLNQYIDAPDSGIDAVGRELLADVNRKAAGELYAAHNPDYFWYTCWNIILTKKNADPQPIGFIFFYGPAVAGCVRTCLYISREYRNQGYGADALSTMAEWAFSQKAVYEVEAFVDKENHPALHSLTSAKYVYRNREHAIERYSIIKPPTAWRGLYTIIGVWVGLTIGIVINNMPVGFGIGLFAGFSTGAAMEVRDAKKRAQLMGKVEEK